MKICFNNFFKSKKLILVKKGIFLNVFLVSFFLQLIVFSNFFGIVSNDAFLAKIVSGILTDLANIERSLLNINQLKVSSVLEKAASLKAQDMAKKSYFAHTSPEGITPWHWFYLVDYDFSYAGENLAINFTNSNVLHRAWVNSYKHRKNILNENFTEIGIGIAESSYNGRNAVFVVQLFGRLKETSSIYQQGEINDLNKEKIKNLEKITANPFPVAVLGVENNNLEIIEKTDSFIVARNLANIEGGNSSFQKDKKDIFSIMRIFSFPQAISLIFIFFIIIFSCLISLNFFRKIKLNCYSCFINSTIIIFIIIASVLVNQWFFYLINLI